MGPILLKTNRQPDPVEQKKHNRGRHRLTEEYRGKSSSLVHARHLRTLAMTRSDVRIAAVKRSVARNAARDVRGRAKRRLLNNLKVLLPQEAIGWSQDPLETRRRPRCRWLLHPQLSEGAAASRSRLVTRPRWKCDAALGVDGCCTRTGPGTNRTSPSLPGGSGDVPALANRALLGLVLSHFGTVAECALRGARTGGGSTSRKSKVVARGSLITRKPSGNSQ